MKDIRKIKAWKQLHTAGYQLVTYRFRNVIVGYGASLYQGQKTLVDIRLISTSDRKRWEVVIDPSLVEAPNHFTLYRDTCRSRDILTTIANIKAGKIRIKTRTDSKCGEVPVYAAYTYPG